MSKREIQPLVANASGVLAMQWVTMISSKLHAVVSRPKMVEKKRRENAYPCYVGHDPSIMLQGGLRRNAVKVRTVRSRRRPFLH
jgi:hypothetical protein